MNKRVHQIDRTRAAIIEAASDLIFGTADPEKFTMQNIADAAGVSHRTVYRHFSSRRDLFNAVGATIDKDLDASLDEQRFESFDRWVETTAEMVAFGVAHRDLLERTVALEIVTGEWRTDRDDAYFRLFRGRYPHLDDQTAREDFAALRHLLSTSSTFLIGNRFELTPGETTTAIDRAAQALIAAIAERDAAAAAEGARV